MATKKKRMFLLALAALLMALLLWTAWGNTALQLNMYTVSSDRLPKAFDGCRIAHVSDLHNAEMGEGNNALLALLREAEPDIIAITGDLIDSRNTDIGIALRFAEEAVKLAPCFYVTGNHEARVSEYADLKAGLTELGVTVLEDERIDLDRNGETITLIGINDPGFRPAQLSDGPAAVKATLQELRDEGGDFTLLLSHRPELFEIYADSGVDLTLSGHAHGGQFRLPLVGGLVAPGQGLFPKYDAGAYTEGRANMIVSRGIGNSIFPFRFNNRPEVVLVELQSGTA